MRGFTLSEGTVKHATQQYKKQLELYDAATKHVQKQMKSMLDSIQKLDNAQTLTI